LAQKKKKREKWDFSAPTRFVSSGIGVEWLLKQYFKHLEGGVKFIDITTNFRLFYRKSCNKICWSPNLESYLHSAHAHGNNINGGLFSYQ